MYRWSCSCVSIVALSNSGSFGWLSAASSPTLFCTAVSLIDDLQKPIFIYVKMCHSVLSLISWLIHNYLEVMSYQRIGSRGGWIQNDSLVVVTVRWIRIQPCATRTTSRIVHLPLSWLECDVERVSTCPTKRSVAVAITAIHRHDYSLMCVFSHFVVFQSSVAICADSVLGIKHVNVAV